MLYPIAIAGSQVDAAEDLYEKNRVKLISAQM
jgi:hypothetical protein